MISADGLYRQRSVGHVPLPAESRPDYVIQVAALWPPAKALVEKVGIRNQCRRIAGPPRGFPHIQRRAADAGHRAQDFAHGMTAAVSAVQDEAIAPLLQATQSQEMDIGEVANMDVVANACAIAGRIVGAVDSDFRPQPEGRFAGDLYQMCRVV